MCMNFSGSMSSKFEILINILTGNQGISVASHKNYECKFNFQYITCIFLMYKFGRELKQTYTFRNFWCLMSCNMRYCLPFRQEIGESILHPMRIMNASSTLKTFRASCTVKSQWRTETKLNLHAFLVFNELCTVAIHEPLFTNSTGNWRTSIYDQ